MTFKQKYSLFQALVEESLNGICDSRLQGDAESVYNPIDYVLKSSGKRIRAILPMLTAEALGCNPHEALYSGVAIEVLHNFTLVHDDIMDNADSRRGVPTIHKKWDSPTAILSGDTMVGLAYVELLKTPSSRLTHLCKIFTRGLVDVCEGQAIDREMEVLTLEQVSRITLNQYVKMITLKTAKLIETAAELGAVIATEDPHKIRLVKEYALNLGIAFQIQDDLLDITADADFGKKIGGDIIEGKKTYLVVSAINMALQGGDKLLLDEFLTKKGLPENRVDEMKNLFDRNGIFTQATSAIEHYTELAFRALDKLDSHNTLYLREFGQMLLKRRK